MKKVLSVIVSITIMLLVISGIGAATPVKAAGNVWYVNASVASSGNGTTPSSAFKTITEGINAASNGDTINVANGTYNEEPSTITVNKKLSIIGESEAGVVIDAGSYGGYGIHITANGVTLKNFTLKSAQSYGIKSDGAVNLDYENITVENSGRSNLDFNGCSNITLNHITAKNSSHGVGIAFTDSNNATASNITTSGNVWGNGQSMGMAVYTYGRYYPGGSSNITLSGANSFGEPVPLYVETDNYNGGSDYPVTNLNVSNDFASIVRLPATLPHQIYFFKDLNTALTIGAQLSSNGFADSVANDTSDISTNGIIDTLPAPDYENYYVGPGMYIQSAVNAAVNGDTILVMPGIYTENVVADKSVTLKGAENHASIIKALDTQNAIVAIRANGVTVDGFTIQDGIVGVCVYNASGAVIKNNIIKNYKGYGYHLSTDPVCNFEYIGEGVLLNNGEAIIHKNIIEADEDGSADPNNSIDSIYLKNGSFARITENVLRNNHYGGTSCHASASGISLKNNSSIIAMGNTIYDNDFGIHPEIKKNHTVNPQVVARYNNIYGNGDTFSTNCFDGSGFMYEKADPNLPNPNPVFDATYNWWGESDESGPYNAEANPSGHGDKITTSKNISIPVSDYINFDPWAGKAGDKTEGITEGVTGGTASLSSIDNTFENGTIGMGADVVPNGNGSSDVMLVKYSQNPTSVSFNASFPGAFFDLNATQPANLDKIVLKLYYPTSHGNLAPFWFDKTESKWKLCSNWQVVPGSVTVDTCNVDNSSYAGYVAVTIDNTTSPTLSELTGTYFTLGGLIIIASAGPGGSISPSGTVYVSYGESQSFIIKPMPGYIIKEITVDGLPAPVANPFGEIYTFSNVTSNHTIRVTFIPIPKPAPAMFSVTVSVSVYGAHAKITPKKQKVKEGDPASVTINPEAGYHITKLTDNGKVVPLSKLIKNPNGTYTYKIDAVYEDHHLTVTLEKDEFVISVKTGKGGTISPSGTLGKVTVYYGENKTFKIAPDSGYKVKEVLVDGKAVSIKDGKYIFFAVKANHSIEVTFVKISTSNSANSNHSTIVTLKIGSPFITVNGVKKRIDSQGSRPIIKNNRTLLPIRAVIESLGGTIQWNGKTREVTIELNGHSIVLKIGSSVALVDGIKTKIDPNDGKVVPIIINGRTYLPLRFIAEHLGATVDWDAETKTVTLYYWP